MIIHALQTVLDPFVLHNENELDLTDISLAIQIPVGKDYLGSCIGG